MLSPQSADEVAATAWDIIANVKVSTSRTQIMAGSKLLHHLMPDLIPPIDLQYTFSFFTGQKMVASDRAAFLDWYPQLAAIGVRGQQPIHDAIKHGGFMATGEAKVIDNAIMGFMQQRRTSISAPPAFLGSQPRWHTRTAAQAIRGYLCLPRPPGPAQARVRCPAGRSSRGCPSRVLSVALSWDASWPGAVARRGSRRVCPARSSVARPR
jgi:hypothetical protein